MDDDLFYRMREELERDYTPRSGQSSYAQESPMYGSRQSGNRYGESQYDYDDYSAQRGSNPQSWHGLSPEAIARMSQSEYDGLMDLSSMAPEQRSNVLALANEHLDRRDQDQARGPARDQFGRSQSQAGGRQQRQTGAASRFR
ncbi:hypothetical protein LTS10_006690 [Elasticomyces elasticus]|nr:hypothetical protein LTS10_006690 [Elasticomyces elasticus]